MKMKTAQILDLLERRRALRIVWELRKKRQNFRELLLAAETNPNVLNSRLKDLRSAGVIDHRDGGYGLTRHGLKLAELLKSLKKWALK